MGQRAGRNQRIVSVDPRSTKQVFAALVNGAEMEMREICAALENSRIPKSSDCL